MLLTVGLTGGIACGKSTVDAMFASLGAHIVDADLIVHDLLGPRGRASAPVIGAFGARVANPDGSVDRAALGDLVFADRDARTHLEGIVHPLVSEEIRNRIESLRSRGGDPIVIVDAALLVETGMDRVFDRLIVVTCSEKAQLERLLASRQLTKEEALQRIRSQASSEDKALRAHYRIDTDGSLEDTKLQVGKVYRSLLAERGKGRS